MKIALITVYYPTNDDIQNISEIGNQADITYICDNSPTNNKQLFAQLKLNIKYIWFNKNLGLSLAFNQILTNSKYTWNDDDYIIFF